MGFNSFLDTGTRLSARGMAHMPTSALPRKSAWLHGGGVTSSLPVISHGRAETTAWRARCHFGAAGMRSNPSGLRLQPMEFGYGYRQMQPLRHRLIDSSQSRRSVDSRPFHRQLPL